MPNLRRSIFVTFFSTNAATAIQFVVTIILSRLLTPSEVGIFSITVVLINILAVFRDFGVSSYLQQEKNLTPEKARSAFGLLLTASWVIAVLTYLSRYSIANYFNEKGVADVLAVLCISYVIVPFAAFYFAILARNFQAGSQAYVNVISAIAYAVVCISLAYLGFGYMSLAWANVANISISIVVYQFIKAKEYTCLPLFRGWKVPLKYGSGAIAGNLLNNINNSLPDLVLGKMSGAESVGLYSRANGLVGIFQQIAGPTIGYNAFPFIAKSHHDKTPLGPILSRATSYLTGVAWPAFIVTAIFAEDIIRFLYGDQWIAAAPIVSLIAFQSLIRFGYSLAQPALLAIGRPYLSVFSAGSSLVIRLAVIYALNANDLMTFAIALCVADVVTAIVPALLMSRYLGYPLRSSIAAHWPSVKVGLFLLLFTILLKVSIPYGYAGYVKMLIITVVLIPLWVITMVILRHPLVEELDAILNKLLPMRIANKLSSMIKKFG